MAYGDRIVIDILRNLLLIIGNINHVAENMRFMHLSNSKYSAAGTPEGFFILNEFSNLQAIPHKLFMAGLLDKRLVGRANFFERIVRGSIG